MSIMRPHSAAFSFAFAFAATLAVVLCREHRRVACFGHAVLCIAPPGRIKSSELRKPARVCSDIYMDIQTEVFNEPGFPLDKHR